MEDTINGVEREIIKMVLQQYYFYAHFLQQFDRKMIEPDSELAGPGQAPAAQP